MLEGLFTGGRGGRAREGVVAIGSAPGVGQPILWVAQPQTAELRPYEIDRVCRLAPTMLYSYTQDSW